MKAWVCKFGRLHLELDVDEATEISLALVQRGRVNVLKAPQLDEMAARIGKAAAHMLTPPRAEPRKPEPGSPAAPPSAAPPPGK